MGYRKRSRSNPEEPILEMMSFPATGNHAEHAVPRRCQYIRLGTEYLSRSVAENRRSTKRALRAH
jgi:hypothetical protein